MSHTWSRDWPKNSWGALHSDGAIVSPNRVRAPFRKAPFSPENLEKIEQERKHQAQELNTWIKKRNVAMKDTARKRALAAGKPYYSDNWNRFNQYRNKGNFTIKARNERNKARNERNKANATARNRALAAGEPYNSGNRF